MTDGIVGELLDKYVVPQLKTGETGKALYNAMLASVRHIAEGCRCGLTRGRRSLSDEAVRKNKGFNIAGIIIFLIAASRASGNKNRSIDVALDTAASGSAVADGAVAARDSAVDWRFGGGRAAAAEPAVIFNAGHGRALCLRSRHCTFNI